MRLTEIHQVGENGVRLAVPCAELVAGGSPRQISLVDGAALSGARKLEGLCVRKFDADFITEGLEYDTLSPGCRLQAGGVEIEISGEKKRCFDECVLRQKGETCPLPRNTAFARVITGGRVEAGAFIKQNNE